MFSSQCIKTPVQQKKKQKTNINTCIAPAKQSAAACVNFKINTSLKKGFSNPGAVMLSGLSGRTLSQTAGGIPPTEVQKFTVSKLICRRKFKRKFSQSV